VQQHFSSHVNWLAVTTHAHRESFAAANLLQQDFAVYCPTTVKRIRHARRIHDAARPLFPGYIFAAACARERLRQLFSTPGVRSIVLCGRYPAHVPGSFVDALRQREKNGIIELPKTKWQPGQQAAIEGGPFDGLVAQIIDIRESDRVLVLLDFLQHFIPGS
jgi:transcription antitermination factor NusG